MTTPDRRLTARGSIVPPTGLSVGATGPTGDRILMAFWLMAPGGAMEVTPPLLLSLTPEALEPSYSKYVEVIQTYGGFVEQHWGEHLVSLSCSHSTGAFVNLKTGLANAEIDPDTGRPYRQDALAMDRKDDLIDLYRSNGLVTGEDGHVLLVGRVRMAFDGGIYDGHFSDLNVEETAEQPFSMRVTWTYKIREVIQQVALASVIGTRIGNG